MTHFSRGFNVTPTFLHWHITQAIQISAYTSEGSSALAPSPPVPCFSIFYFSPFSQYYWCSVHILSMLSIPVHVNGFLLQAPWILCFRIFLAAGACSVMREVGWECQHPSPKDKWELADNIPAPHHPWGKIWGCALHRAPHQGCVAVSNRHNFLINAPVLASFPPLPHFHILLLCFLESSHK